MCQHDSSQRVKFDSTYSPVTRKKFSPDLTMRPTHITLSIHIINENDGRGRNDNDRKQTDNKRVDSSIKVRRGGY